MFIETPRLDLCIMHCVQVQNLGVTLYSIFNLKLVQLKGTEHDFKEGDWIKGVEHEFQ